MFPTQIPLTALKAVFSNIPFSICPNVSTHTFETKDGQPLDRYPDICVHSVIKPDTAVTINTNGYINANFIDGVTPPRKYIACQAPLNHTINDFWQMVWEQNSRVIVMLTPLEEEVIVEGTPQKRIKSAQYWPDVSRNHGNLTVQRLQETPMPNNLQTTKFQLSHSSSYEKREIWHIHLTSWPDHGATGPDALLKTLQVCREKVIEAKTSAPIIVHCSAGVGRTGTFIASDMCWDKLQQHIEPNVVEIVTEIRKQRYVLVQTVEQFQLIHDLVPILQKTPPPMSLS